MARLDWIGVWCCEGALGVWLMAADGSVLDRHVLQEAAQPVTPDDVAARLLPLVAGMSLADRIDPVPVIACGLEGAAPLRTVPCAAPGIAEAARVPTPDPRLDLRVLPGLAQRQPRAVMRGGETVIAGLFAVAPGFDGVLCLCGAASTVWARLSAGEVVSFATFMTGEMLEMLGTDMNQQNDDRDAFTAALAEAMSRPAGLASMLSAVRAEADLDALAPAAVQARISGALIGAELAAARPYWLGQTVVVAGEGALAEAYGAALADQGAAPRSARSQDLALAGLTAARRQLASPEV
ncbi:2-dehydro-3-deoxygalactonokinase [Anianabacter salinae]|uniref:2-dehydro-3-deoxygalactonokinase n=1 Tax=Anianabacter salinae TaxID=2851023 RepID=UPI00225E0DF8|nr:2-dehydro-3-deoxygalactonokinase [Anianabacter salinae]MBV0912764.1 2-dehydro-3-deoxygalactonokinase [Anianabacter salinae]